MNRFVAAAALSLLSAGAAIAQSSDDQQACMNDAFRVCSATIPDRNKTIACMVQNKAKLSSACQVVMDKIRAIEHHDRLRVGNARRGGARPHRDPQRVDEAGRIQAGQDRGHNAAHRKAAQHSAAVSEKPRL